MPTEIAPNPSAQLVTDRTAQNWIGAGPPPQAGPGSGVPAFDLSGSDRLARALKQLPHVGDECFGFRLVRELGRGSFGRVFLATQPELAGRHVALKVTADLSGEARTLARLQHTNIVPVYSAHRSGDLQAACMPYLGSATMADLLKRFRDANGVPATGRQFVDTLKNATRHTEPKTGLTPPEGRPDAEPHAGKTEAILKHLSGLSYVRAVCWIVARLADGLAHAHDRGVLHRDIKPANILLTDDGQPMLLDFGIAEDVQTKAAAVGSSVGGTLPYMAPELLDAIGTSTASGDARSDLFALGIVLYELLTGRYPWRVPTGTVDQEVPRMAAERRDDPPSVRAHNPNVSPGLESIVHTCLAGNPGRRYQSADQLRDDLERFLADRPLAVAPERSATERARKWARRHPWIMSNATIAAVAALVLTGGAAAAVSRERRLERLEAEEMRREFADDLKAAQFLLTARSTDAAQADAGLAKAQAALDRYGVANDPNWDRRSAFVALAEADQAKVRDELTEACLLLARGHLLKAKTEGESHLRAALTLNELAERVSAGAAPGAVFHQRADILRRLGRTADADAAAKTAADAKPRTAQDFYLAAAEHSAHGRYKEALPLYRKALDRDPRHFWATFGLGVCQDHVGLVFDARGTYTAAIALEPGFAWAHFNRGLAHLKIRDYEQAVIDLTRAADLKSDAADVYLNRAIAHQGKADYKAGIADLDRALALGAPKARVYFARAQQRAAAGDKDGAKQDTAAALATPPTDAPGWVARGLARLATDLPGALADFEEALKLNPRSVQALQNKSHALSKLGRTKESLAVLDRILDLSPESVPARAGRGVLHSRLGNWAAALADAKDALARDAGPANVYQVAGIYAMLTKHDPAHKAEALTLLASALRAGFGHDYLPTDKELDPIRETPEFKRLVAAVNELKPPTKR